MDRFVIDHISETFAYINNKDEINHISKTLRLKKGDKIEVIDGKGFIAIAGISNIEKSEIRLEILQEKNDSRELEIEIILYQGIPKLQKMEFIIQKSTEIGISEIIPVNLDRCVKKIKDKEDKQIERWQRIALEATKQSKRSIIPKISNSMSIKEMVNHMSKNDLNIVCYENEEDISIKNILRDIGNYKSKRIGIIIGAEGGITEEEHKILIDNGALSASLCKSILRTETAAIFATAVIAYELG